MSSLDFTDYFFCLLTVSDPTWARLRFAKSSFSAPSFEYLNYKSLFAEDTIYNHQQTHDGVMFRHHGKEES